MSARLLAGAFLLAGVFPAAAATWVCGLSDDGTRLVCAADTEAGDDAAATPVAPTAVVNGTRFPLDAARVYTVPLWTTPTEPEFVALLARATICYRTPRCSVVLAPSPWLKVASASPTPRP